MLTLARSHRFDSLVKMDQQQPGPSNATHVKKNPSGKFVRSEQKKIVINFYKELKREQPEMKYKEMIKRLSKETGIGQLTISKTISEYRETATVTSPNTKRPRLKIEEKVLEEEKHLIRRKVYEFWLHREIPNMKKMLQVVNEDPLLPNFSESTLYRLLKSMQFKCFVRARYSALMDKGSNVLWRNKYIITVQQYRSEGREIYYLGETWVTADNCRRRVWVDQSVTSREAEQRGLLGNLESTGKGKGIILAHIGSVEGFVPGSLLLFKTKKEKGDCHDEMNWDSFFTWFRNMLPKLKQNSVIVMDNAPCHSKKLIKYPTMTWRKNKVIAWLVAKGEQVPPDVVKAQLLELVQKYKIKNNFLVDHYAKQQNHTVLRLPPYHYELNPIVSAWAMVKRYVEAGNTSYKLENVKKLIEDAVEHVTVESWQNFIRHTIEEENKLLQMDHITDDLMDELTDTSDWSIEDEEESENETENDEDDHFCGKLS
ncbi:uncharacterized protein LOC143359248 isoform X2 [Halictus rubicundus]|uniref:uncharacterized protein LOC143359248 isoform X2 n=1 Tax=Halictus rubicundus TaxID=77578 RepID=UPI0040351CD3